MNNRKRSECESCKIFLKAGDFDIANNAYLNVLSRGGHQSYLLILYVVTLLFYIWLRQILWLYF